MDDDEKRDGKGKRFVTTTVRIRSDVWDKLRQLAHVRALDRGGRASASALIGELVEAEAGRQAAQRAGRGDA